MTHFFLYLFLMIAAVGSVFAESGNVLGRTANALAVSKKLTIGYLGGSLTNGSGASNAEKTSWRALTTEWFRQRFPDAEIQEINAGIGGTGSDLGVYRVGGDILGKVPDLVFVEFAVNDAGRGVDKVDSVTPAMEGIVRQIWKVNPYADIVFIYTTMKSFEEFHVKGERPPSVILHQKVADHYEIPSVNIGEALWNHMMKEGKTWEELLPDKVHPNDAGYAIYAGEIRKFLEAQDWGKSSSSAVVMPASMSATVPENPRFVDATPYATGQWTVEACGVGRFSRLIASETPGEELTFNFRGNAIGVYWLSADDSGDIEWSVDGSPFKRRASWSPYGGVNGRPYSAMFFDPIWGGKLPSGEHNLKLRVAPEADSRSKGNRVRLMAFIVNESPE